MNIKKIVFICYLPLNERFVKEFYLEEFEKNGFLVEYWDITEVYFPNKFRNKLNSKYSRKIDSYKLLLDTIKQQNQSNTIYFLHITYRGVVIKLYRILTKNKCFIAHLSRFAVVTNKTSEYAANLKLLRLKTLIKKALSVKEVFRYASDRMSIILKIIGYIKTYDIIFNAGHSGITTVGRGWDIDQKQSKIVQINSIDYDRFLLNQIESLFDKKYCVFLDQYYPFHPDLLVSGEKHISPNLYYSSLNAFFEKIESTLNIEVIVAAHPLADKYAEQNYFCGRKIYFNKTVDLIAKAEYVIAHTSTAISYAVLFKKPLIFITDNNIKNNMQGVHLGINAFAKELECSVINLNNYSIDTIYNIDCDSNVYERYKYNYLTSKDSESTDSFSILLKTINSL